ncbi:hypothetical protein BJV77DRAFT_960224 [Russula vinacea]|nr:hypothetical protein BJV77DRAFT_960224 [Russula vinacea]
MYSLGALALSLFSLLSAVSALPSPTPSRFSKRWSSQFGKFVGTNAYWLPYLNSEDDICNTLANMSKAGITVVRTWAFNDVSTIPDAGSYLQLIKTRLDTVIALAKKYNIRVYFTLTNNWAPFVNDDSPSSFPRNFLSNDYGGMDLYVKEFGVTKTHDEFYTNMKIREEFNNMYSLWFRAMPMSRASLLGSWPMTLAANLPCPLRISATRTSSPNGTQRQPSSSALSTLITSLLRGANVLRIKPTFSRGEEAEQQYWSCVQWSIWCRQRRYSECSDIDFGTFQLFPDQNHYGITGSQVQAPSSNFNNTLNETNSWIRAQADTIQKWHGKPVVLSAFGIVAQDTLQQFVPFNSTCLLVKPQQDWKRQDPGANGGVNQQQYNSAYNSWLNQGAQGGLWSAQGLTTAPGTLVPGPNGANPARRQDNGAEGGSPGDGYNTNGGEEQGVPSDLANQAASFPSPPPVED